MAADDTPHTWGEELDIGGSVLPESMTTVEADAGTSLAETTRLTPWTDGGWWIDHDGRLVGWSDWPPEAVLPFARGDR